MQPGDHSEFNTDRVRVKFIKCKQISFSSQSCGRSALHLRRLLCCKRLLLRNNAWIVGKKKISWLFSSHLHAASHCQASDITIATEDEIRKHPHYMSLRSHLQWRTGLPKPRDLIFRSFIFQTRTDLCQNFCMI